MKNLRRGLVGLLLLFFSLIITLGQDPIPEINGRNTGHLTARERRNLKKTTRLLNNMSTILKWGDSAIVDLRYIDFKTTDGWEMQEGRVGWNDEDKTLEAGLDAGSVLQIGQEIHMRVVNKTVDTIYDGKVVYVAGAHGNRPTIELASDTSITALLTLGLATQDIPPNRNGYVTLVGLVRGIDTRDYVAGVPLWVSSEPGAMTTTRPDAPAHAVTLGVALNSTEDGIVAIRPVVVQRLSWLSDVKGRDNESENNILVWNADSLFWELRDSLAINAIRYTDAYWDDLKAPFTQAKLGVQDKPDFDYDNVGLLFPSSDTAEYVTAIMQFSHEREAGSDIGPHLHWKQVNSNNVVWKAVYKWYDPGDLIPDVWLPLVEVSDAFEYTSGTLAQITSFGTIDGSSLIGVSSIFEVKVYRDDSVDGGAGGNDVLATEFDLHYQLNTPGSAEEYIKY